MLDDAWYSTPDGTPSTDYTTTETCPRCNGTAIDPKRKWPEDWLQVVRAEMAEMAGNRAGDAVTAALAGARGRL